MPAAKPLEFRRRAVELARQWEKPIAEIAAAVVLSAVGQGLALWVAGCSSAVR